MCLHVSVWIFRIISLLLLSSSCLLCPDCILGVINMSNVEKNVSLFLRCLNLFLFHWCFLICLWDVFVSFVGFWECDACFRVSLTTCQFALYENCTVVVYRVICRCFTVLCLYVSTCLSCLSCVWISAPWREVHFSNWRSNLNLCINSFPGFERLCYGCETTELCLFVFLLFVLVTFTYCVCVVIDILVLWIDLVLMVI